MIELLMAGDLPVVIEEVAAVGKELLSQQRPPTGEMDEQLELVKQIVVLCHIPLDQPSPVQLTMETPYDLGAWVRDRYVRSLDAYK